MDNTISTSEIGTLTNNLVRDAGNKFNTAGANSAQTVNLASMLPKASKKQSFTETSNARPEDLYQTLNDGTKVAKYENYIPGTNNEERLAQGQSTGEKWLHGAEKTFLKTANVVLGNTAGFVYGIGKAISDGSLSSIYDNDFVKTVDDWNTKLDYKLPNYYSEQEKNSNLLGKMGSANFWANDIIAGSAFTLGTVASEAIWAYATGGASLGLRLAKFGSKLGTTARVVEGVGAATRAGQEAVSIGKTLGGLEKMKSFVKMPLKSAASKGIVNVEGAIKWGKVGEKLNTWRFAATSSGAESATEAWHYKKEARENYLKSFEDMNARQPTTGEMIAFEENLANSANAVFATNVALVGGANVLFLGGSFGIKNPFKSLSNTADKKLFGIGTKTVETAGKKTVEAIKATKWQKVTGTTFGTAKNLFNEAIVEEGGQSVTTKTANKWIESTYNPKYTSQNLDLMGAVYESMGEQYGTAEGWNEIGTAAIMTMFGGGVTGNLFGEGSAKINQRRGDMAYNAAGMNTFDTETVVGNIMRDRMKMSNQLQGAQERQAEAEANGDIVGGEVARNDSMFSRIHFNHNIKRDITEDLSDLKIGMDLMTAEQFKEQGIEESNIDAFKEQTISEYKTLSESYAKNREFAEAMTGGSNTFEGHKAADINAGFEVDGNKISTGDKSALVEALTYNLTMGEVTGGLQNDLLSSIKKEVLGSFSNSKFSTHLDINNILQNASKKTTKEFYAANQEVTEARREKTALEAELVELERNKNTKEDNTVYNRRYAALSGRIIELNNKSQELEQKRNTLLHTAKIENPFIKDDINVSTLDLDQTEGQLEELSGLIDNLEETNPVAHARIKKLTEEYNKSVNQFREFNNAARALTDKKYNPKLETSFLSKMLNSGKSMDEFSKDFFIKTIADYRATKSKFMSDEAEAINADVSNEDYQAFKEDKLSEELVNSIAQKNKKRIKLLPKEQEVYNKHKADIDIAESKIVDAIEVDPQAIIDAQIAELEKERDAKIAAIAKNKPTVNPNQKPATELKVGDRVLKQKDEYVTITSIDSNVDGSVNRVITDGGVFTNVKADPLSWALTIENTSETVVKDTTAEDAQKIQEEYDTKIEALKKGGLTATEKLEKRIKEAIKANKLSMTYVGDTYDDIINKEPTKEEIAEYAEYIDKIQNSKRKDKNYAVRLNPAFATGTKADIGLTKEELVKFQALNFKLAQWRMLDGAVTGEQESISDLIEILNQLKVALEKDATKSEVTKQESIDILETEDMRAANDATQVSFTQVHDVVTAKMVQVEGVRMVRFSDLNIATVVDKMGATPTIIDPKGNIGKATAALIEEFGKKEGTKFVFEGVTFTIGTKGRISVKEEEFNAVKEQLNLTPLSSSFTHGTYVPVYQSAEQGGEMTQASSDFVHKSTDGAELPYTPDALYETKEGEYVRFQIRMDDSHNVYLINKYKASKKTNKDKKELEDNLVINTIKDDSGEVTGSLKATNRTENLDFLNIRKAAFEKVMESIRTKSLIVTLTVPATVRVKKIILGIPNMTVRQTAEGYEPVNKDFNEETIKQVVNTGYVQNGKSTLSRDGKGVRFDFVTKISKNNPTKKIPIIVFEYKGLKIAFPVSLISTPNSKISTIEDIMATNESDANKVKMINQALIENNIEPKQFELTDLNPSKVAAIAKVMDSIQDFVSAEYLADKDYDVNQLITQAQIAIDLTNRPIGAPKMVMDLASYSGETFKEPEMTEEEVAQEEEDKVADNSRVNSITKELGKLTKKMEVLDKKIAEAEAIYESQKAALTKSRAKISAFDSIRNTRDKTVGKLDAQVEILDDQIVNLENLMEEILEEANEQILTTPSEHTAEVEDDLIRDCA